MPVSKPLSFVVKWEMVRAEYEGWIDQMQGERALYTFIAKHPSWVEPGAELAGIQVWIPEAGYVDLILRKKEDYYVIEAKDGLANLDDAKEEASNYATALEKHLVERGILHNFIVPVGATIEYKKASEGYEYQKVTTPLVHED